MKEVPRKLMELKNRLDMAQPNIYNLVKNLTVTNGIDFKEKNFDYMADELAEIISKYKLATNRINPEDQIIAFSGDSYLKQVLPQGLGSGALEKNIESAGSDIRNLGLDGAVYFMPFGMGGDISEIKEKYPSVFVDLGYTPDSVAHEMNKVKKVYYPAKVNRK